jgi:hypothetical protein
MNVGNVFLGAAALTMPCAPASALAQPSNGQVDRSEIIVRELTTDMQLLSGLTERRAAIAKSTMEGKDDALAFVDRQIARLTARLAEVRSQLGK